MTTTQTGIHLPLVGHDGNAFMILARAHSALKRSRLPDWQSIDAAFQKEATSGDYQHLLRTVAAYFVVDAEDDNDE